MGERVVVIILSSPFIPISSSVRLQQTHPNVLKTRNVHKPTIFLSRI